MRIFTITLSLLLSISNLKGQDIFEQMSRDVCKCLTKHEEVLNHQEAKVKCFEESMSDNLNQIMKHYNTDSVSVINREDLVNKMAIKLLKDCEIAYKYFNKDSLTKGQIQKNYTLDHSLNCDKIKNGNYYYLTPNQSGLLDTTFVSMNGTTYLETFGTDDKYSKLKITWVNNCQFQLTFIESNDSFKNTLSKKGDKYDYEVIQNLPKMIILKLIFHGDEYFVEFHKK